MTLADKLRPYVNEIKSSAEAGNFKAQEIIKLYQMHINCPGDPAAPALCKAVFDDWIISK